MIKTMRARTLIVLSFVGASLAWGSPAYAAVIDSQMDDSAEATRPSTRSSVVVGYVPTTNSKIFGVRFRVNTSGAGDYLCPTGNILQYGGTSTPTTWGSDLIIGAIVPVVTTTPDADGNCDYTTIDQYANSSPITVSKSNYYVFPIAAGGSLNKWVSMSGKSFTSSTTQSLFGYRPATSGSYVWGTTGLDAAYVEFFDTAPPAIPSRPEASNVLFLPGIEGSRLYEGAGCDANAGEEKLWEPLADSAIRILRGAGDTKVKSLFLDSAGESVCGDIYAKADDVIDSVGGSNIYKSFIDEMNGLKADGTINDWKAAAYDWRLSLGDLLHKGTERDGKIYYEESTSTPYIEQALRALAASSRSGKVSIVAHSNGGLVAKALLNQLGSSTSRLLVDKVILVGAPQSGAPVDVGALLYGLDQGISSWGIPILHSSVARALAQNSPMAYHLLPSEDYLESTMGDAAHSVAHFAGNGYAKEISAYGATIANRVALDDFLLARDGGREKPKISDTSSAEVLNAPLIDYANSAHAALDVWTPPDGVEVDQIAGWGADTVAGIDFYTTQSASILAAPGPVRMYRPVFVEDGDGTVPVPSALMMASSANVKRYWVDLHAYNKLASVKRSHRDLFEIPSLQDFIKNIIKNSGTLTPYITSSQPPPTSANKKLTFFLHSSVVPQASATSESEVSSGNITLRVVHPSGQVTGLAEDGSLTEDIPGSSYGEFGNVKYVIIPEPQGSQYQLMLRGQGDVGQASNFSLDIQESSGNVVTATTTIANVPVVAGTMASLTISDGIGTASPLTVDENGDGGDIITITPVVGETVSYEPPAPEPATDVSSAGDVRADLPFIGGGAGGPGPTYLTIVPAVTSTVPFISDIATTTPPVIAGTTPAAATTTPVATTTLATSTTASAAKPWLAVATPRASKRMAAGVSPAAVANTVSRVPQTASVYEASQHTILNQVLAVIYNGLYGFWTALKKFL